MLVADLEDFSGMTDDTSAAGLPVGGRVEDNSRIRLILSPLHQSRLSTAEKNAPRVAASSRAQPVVPSIQIRLSTRRENEDPRVSKSEQISVYGFSMIVAVTKKSKLVLGRSTMRASSRNEIKGKVHQVKGTIKKKLGQLTDNPKLEIEGATESFAGRLQHKLGQMQKVVEKP
jgi:uncharacterized protein YjbJ (UPF0337 family)